MVCYGLPKADAAGSRAGSCRAAGLRRTAHPTPAVLLTRVIHVDVLAQHVRVVVLECAVLCGIDKPRSPMLVIDCRLEGPTVQLE